MDLNHDRLCIRQVLSTRLSYRPFWWAGVEFAPPQLAASLLQSVGLTRAQPTHDADDRRLTADHRRRTEAGDRRQVPYRSVAPFTLSPFHLVILSQLVPPAGAAPTLGVWKTPALLLRHGGLLDFGFWILDYERSI
jgi:hypothetical protein